MDPWLFYLLASVNNAAPNTGSSPAFTYFEYTPRSATAGSCGICFRFFKADFNALNLIFSQSWWQRFSTRQLTLWAQGLRPVLLALYSLESSCSTRAASSQGHGAPLQLRQATCQPPSLSDPWLRGQLEARSPPVMLGQLLKQGRPHFLLYIMQEVIAPTLVLHCNRYTF